MGAKVVIWPARWRDEEGLQSHHIAAGTARMHQLGKKTGAEDDPAILVMKGCKFGKGMGKGKGKGKDGKGKGETLCANCGQKGHTSQQCPKPPLPWSERPCH